MFEPIDQRSAEEADVVAQLQRDGDFLEVAVILGVSSVRPFNISAPSGLIIQRKLLGFRIRAKSKVHKNSDKNDHQGLRYKRF